MAALVVTFRKIILRSPTMTKQKRINIQIPSLEGFALETEYKILNNFCSDNENL